jgi:hypothetical protein
MQTIGFNLLFYGTYWDEMELLYGEEDYSSLDYPGELDLDNIKLQVTKIGDAAVKEAKQLLEELSADIILVLKKHKGYRKRSWKPRDSWEVGIWLSPIKIKRDLRRLLLGVSIDYVDGHTAIRPWVQIKGGRSAADDLRKLIGSGEVCPEYNNALMLGNVPLPNFRSDKSVATEPIRHAVVKEFDPLFRNLPKVWKRANGKLQ